MTAIISGRKELKSHAGIFARENLPVFNVREGLARICFFGMEDGAIAKIVSAPSHRNALKQRATARHNIPCSGIQNRKGKPKKINNVYTTHVGDNNSLLRLARQPTGADKIILDKTVPAKLGHTTYVGCITMIEANSKFKNKGDVL